MSKTVTVAQVKLKAACPSTEYSIQFLQGMVDRMSVSFHKYGAVNDGFPYPANALESLQMRLDKYAETGNTEWLMDVANFAMIEFMRPRTLAAHFQATDSDASPGRATSSGITDAGNKAIKPPLSPALASRRVRDGD